MNISKLLSRTGLFIMGVAMVLTAVRCSNEVYAQNNTESEALVARAIETQNYVFKARQAMPSAGRTRQLNTDYDLRVSKDSVASWLPYFGRAYQAPLDPTKESLS